VPQPLLSIVTPSLNQGRYIGQCLESVAAEMASPAAREYGVEHIVMDGGSTDETVRLLEQASHLVHWQSEPDGGQSAAINRGLLDHARGRYATWINADDWFEPGALGPMLDRLVREDAPDVLVGRCRFVEGDRTIFSPKPPEPIDMANLLRLRTKWFAGELIVQPEAFFDRGLFKRTGGLNEGNHFTMDHELWLKLLETGGRFEAMDHPVACMRVHAEQKTADNRRIVESLIRFGQPFLDRLGECGDTARREVAAMDYKLALSGPVLRRLRLPWAGRQVADASERITAASPAEFHLPPLRAVLEGLPQASGLFRRGYRARVVGDAPLSGMPLRFTPRTEPPFDAVVLWHAIGTSVDPSQILRDALAGLNINGVVIAGAELAPCESGLRQYTDGLAGLVDQQLSQDHDWLIDVAAMRWVESMATATPADDARWATSHPHPFGVDLEALMADAGLERIASMRYGGMSWHPLTPFAAIEGVPGRDADAWTCGVWRKR